jgi:hypothetical protein
MKPYKILLNTTCKIRKTKIVPPIKKVKVPLYFCKNAIALRKNQIISPP